MLTGNFTGELSTQKMSQVQADVAAHRTAQRAVRTIRRHKELSRPAVMVYRMVLRAVALGLVLVVAVASAAAAMPAPREVSVKAAKSAQPPAHLPQLVGTGTPADAWLGLAGVVLVVLLLVAVSVRRRGATASAVR